MPRCRASRRRPQPRFLEMLVLAQEEHPGARVLIKTHPETAGGNYRTGHFARAMTTVTGLRCPRLSPHGSCWTARSGSTPSRSQLGFEAILAGHRPVVLGQPFYAGWGLRTDEFPVPIDRRQRRLTRAQLFAAAIDPLPHMVRPYRDRLARWKRRSTPSRPDPRMARGPAWLGRRPDAAVETRAPAKMFGRTADESLPMVRPACRRAAHGLGGPDDSRIPPMTAPSGWRTADPAFARAGRRPDPAALARDRRSRDLL